MNKRHKTIPVFVPHLGCPQDCLFCNQKKITGELKQVTEERVRELIRIGASHKNKGERLEIGFFGGSFTGIPKEEQEALLQPAFEAKNEGLLDGIRLSTRPDYINDEIIERLLAFGVTTVELGAQSMDDVVLNTANRGHSAEQTIKAAEMIKKSGLGLGLQMMIGLPEDSKEKSIKTAQEFCAMQPECVRIYPTLVIKDTALAELWKNGGYQPLSLDEAVDTCKQVYHIFEKDNIEVIRMGLLNMQAEDILAGPYHPSFGELVLSAVFYDKIKAALEGYKSPVLHLQAHPSYVSVISGHRRKNILKLKEEFGFKEVKVLQAEHAKRGTFEILPPIF